MQASCKSWSSKSIRFRFRTLSFSALVHKVPISRRFSDHRSRKPRLRLDPRVSKAERELLRSVLNGLPGLCGRPIAISVSPSLTVHRGKLVSGRPGCGTPVYAASYIRKRKIVLENDLLRRGKTLRLILVHELFHFVWPRLGNSQRKAFADLLRCELQGRARGELGESAGVQKGLLTTRDGDVGNIREWRDYVCEGFCDTAAWIYAGVRRHDSFTLAKRWRERRKVWFREVFGSFWKC